MININNTNNEQEKNNNNNDLKPDENSGVIVQEFFRISDPETGETLTQGRD